MIELIGSMVKCVDIVMKTRFSVINVYDIEKGDSNFVGDYVMYRKKTSVKHQ
jgi:hypothetical protein